MAKLKSEIKWWYQRAKNLYHLGVSVWFVIKYGYPAKKLTVIGVTGTDGKTTTCTLIYEILRKAGGGIKPALLTSVSARVGDSEIETGLHTTNPDARLMQPILARMVAEGVTHLVLEVTAHGLDQFRVWGCNISIGVLTNITHEHLDDFVDMKRYREAKAKLLVSAQYSVLNKDDASFEWFKARCRGRVIPYGKTRIKDISLALAGDYNKYNIGAAEAVAEILGIERVVPLVVRSFRGVPGRREEVKAGQKFRVIVDFAHTPNALEQVLEQLRKELPAGKKLIAVFGCTGGRDKTKRPMMGGIAARLAEAVIVTSDDTRGENQDDIYVQIVGGMADRQPIKENDRRRAIGMAVKMAKPGDIILLAGKGHEKSLLIGKTEIPWSDAEEAKRAMKRKGRGF